MLLGFVMQAHTKEFTSNYTTDVDNFMRSSLVEKLTDKSFMRSKFVDMFVDKLVNRLTKLDSVLADKFNAEMENFMKASLVDKLVDKLADKLADKLINNLLFSLNNYRVLIQGHLWKLVSKIKKLFNKEDVQKIEEEKKKEEEEQKGHGFPLRNIASWWCHKSDKGGVTSPASKPVSIPWYKSERAMGLFTMLCGSILMLWDTVAFRLR